MIIGMGPRQSVTHSYIYMHLNILNRRDQEQGEKVCFGITYENPMRYSTTKAPFSHDWHETPPVYLLSWFHCGQLEWTVSVMNNLYNIIWLLTKGVLTKIGIIQMERKGQTEAGIQARILKKIAVGDGNILYKKRVIGGANLYKKCMYIIRAHCGRQCKL